MLRKQFWLDAFERAVKTFAQVLLAVFLGDTALTVVNFTWTKSLALAGTAAVVSLLTSVVSAQIGPDNSASLVGEPPKT